MTGNILIDHIVILVDDLDAGIAEFRRLGFAVTRGGEHPAWGSHNALIALQDGTYLELIAFRTRSRAGPRMTKETLTDHLAAEGRSSVERRVLAWQAPPEGLVDFALLPTDTQRDIAQARQNGLEIEGPFPGSRTRPDGQTVRWQLGISSTFDVPFLCGDVTDRSLRVPSGDAAHHPNGAIAIDRLQVATANLDNTILRYRALLGIAPHNVGSTLPETTCAACGIGQATILLHAPTGPRSPIHKILTARGQGPFALDLQTTDLHHAGPLSLASDMHISLITKTA